TRAKRYRLRSLTRATAFAPPIAREPVASRPGAIFKVRLSPMRFDLITIFPEFFGGGEGMFKKCEPLFDAVELLLGPVSNTNPPARTAIVLLSAAGKLFRQE